MNSVLEADELYCGIQLLWLSSNTNLGTSYPTTTLPPVPINISSLSSSTDSSLSLLSSLPSTTCTCSITNQLSTQKGIPIIVRADCAYQQRHLRHAFTKRPLYTIIDIDNHCLLHSTSPVQPSFTSMDYLIQINEYENIEWEHVMNKPYSTYPPSYKE